MSRYQPRIPTALALGVCQEDCYFKAGHYQNGNVAILADGWKDKIAAFIS